MSYPDVPFVDRDKALTRLREGLNHPEPRIHIICGQTGVGKSKLAIEFSEQCESDGHPTLYYEMGEPRNEKVFLQRLLAAWYEKYPASTATQLREYLLSPDSVDDLLGVIRKAMPDPGSSLAIESLRKAISGTTESDIDFPDPVQLVTDVMKQKGSPESPVVVVIDQYDVSTHDREGSLESTFRDISNHLDESVVWYVTTDTEIRGDGLDCFQLEPFDQDIGPNPGASYPADREPFAGNHNRSEQALQATRELVEEAGLDYEEADLVDLHDRTKGVPLLIATICEESESLSLREELSDKPRNYNQFENKIQQDFIRDLTDEQRQILIETSVMPVFTIDICAKRTGISRLKIRQNLDELVEEGKLMRLQSEYPVNPAYKCHDFYRMFLIEYSPLEERELRLEAARDCLELAFEAHSEADSEDMDSGMELQLDRFSHQISKVEESRSVSEIADMVAKGSEKSRDEISELLAIYLEFGHRDYELEDYIEKIV